ncbi:MAG: hypothetical protein WDN01_22380 [Rhizomicrobium sp.]
MILSPDMRRRLPAALKRVAKAVLPASAGKPSRGEVLEAAARRPNWRLLWLLFRERLPRR